MSDSSDWRERKPRSNRFRQTAIESTNSREAESEKKRKITRKGEESTKATEIKGKSNCWCLEGHTLKESKQSSSKVCPVGRKTGRRPKLKMNPCTGMCSCRGWIPVLLEYMYCNSCYYTGIAILFALGIKIIKMPNIANMANNIRNNTGN